MTRNDVDRDALSLEQSFYAGESAEWLEKLRRKTDAEQQREALREVVQVKDDAFINRLVALGIRAETAVALRIIPLVVVAWADGPPDERECEAVLRAASERALTAERTARRMLDVWLRREPDPALLARWKTYVARIWNRFTFEEQWQMRKNLLGSAREVAEAAGGFLGLTSGISAKEKAVLRELEELLS